MQESRLEECGALLTLLDRLGYDGNGNHPENRHLVTGQD